MKINEILLHSQSIPDVTAESITVGTCHPEDQNKCHEIIIFPIRITDVKTINKKRY